MILFVNICVRVCVSGCECTFLCVPVHPLVCVRLRTYVGVCPGLCVRMCVSLYIHLYIFTNLALAGCDTRSIFKRSLIGLNSEFSFSYTGCPTKVKEPNMSYYIAITEGRIVGFIAFPRTLVQCEMQLASSDVCVHLCLSVYVWAGGGFQCMCGRGGFLCMYVYMYVRPFLCVCMHMCV